MMEVTYLGYVLGVPASSDDDAVALEHRRVGQFSGDHAHIT